MYVNYIMLKEESAAPGRPNVDEAHSAIYILYMKSTTTAPFPYLYSSSESNATATLSWK
jgi:hypothetical protein